MRQRVGEVLLAMSGKFNDSEQSFSKLLTQVYGMSEGDFMMCRRRGI